MTHLAQPLNLQHEFIASISDPRVCTQCNEVRYQHVRLACQHSLCAGYDFCRYAENRCLTPHCNRTRMPNRAFCEGCTNRGVNVYGAK